MIPLIGALLVGAALAFVVWGLLAREPKVRLPEELTGHHGGRLTTLAREAEGLLARRGFFRGLTSELPRAGIDLPPGRFLLLAFGGSILAGFLIAALWGTPALGPFAALGTFLVVRFVVRRRARKWTDKFEAELPDALDLLAGSLEVGTSLAQAMELVAAEGRPPLSEEFERILSDNRLGESLVDAMEDAAKRIGSQDFAWCVRAVRVQQEFGASLASVFQTLAEFMRWRDEIKREVRALTAEGRISAYVLIALPFGIGVFLSIVNPDYLALLVTTPIGWLLTIIAGVLMVIGAVWMTKIVKVEV
jgi:tight adherence protein B